ncbi:MAG: hypothetical protein E7616_02990, partial [Ruminococcaceae bacterium]|nr:hypothetical protein [Oscillospiraceae bacterium]
MKKIVSMFLAVLMVFTIIPLAAINVSAATNLTEEQFSSKLAILRTEYPDGKYWNNYNGQITSGELKGTSKVGNVKCKCAKTCLTTCSCSCGTLRINNSDVAWQCHGYALLLAYKVFGSNINSSSDWEKITSLKNYEFNAGDVVRTNEGHTIFIYRVEGNNVYYTDCNYSGPCQINWDGEYTVSKLKSIGTYVRHLSGNILKGTENEKESNTLTINYNANGGTIDSTITGHKYEVTANEGLNMRSGAGTSNSLVKSFAKGTTFTVDVGNTKNANGYTWGKTTIDGKTGWVVISDFVSETGVLRNTDYYLNASLVYKTSTASAIADKVSYGVAPPNGLYNASTFKLTREGYSFVGWSASPDGSTTVFDQDDTALKAEDICPALKDGNKSITLYAIWKENISPITGISISKEPDKQVYKVDDTFDPAGMEIIVQYENGSFKTITEGFQLEYEFSNPGYVSVEIVYEGVSAWTSVLVYDEIAVEAFSAEGYIGQTITIPIGYFTNAQECIGAMSFSAMISYDSAKLHYKGFVNTSALDSTRLVVNPATDGIIYLAYANDEAMPADCILVELQFVIIGAISDKCAVAIDRFELFDSASRSYMVATYPGTVTNHGPIIISFDAMGGINAPQAVTAQYGQMVSLPNTVPLRDGYTFLGWSTSSTAIIPTYLAGDKYTNDGPITLYAVWKNGCPENHEYYYCISDTPNISKTGTLTGTCSRCSATTTIILPKLSATDYTYSITKAATCTEAGTGCYTWKTTTYGTYSFNVTIPSNGHSYTSKVTVPTCTAQGYTTYTCACGDSYKTNYVNALGHIYNYKSTKAPTTSAAGTLTGTCTVCAGTTTIALPKLSATDYTYSITKAATCTEAGTGCYTWKTTTYGTYSFNVTIP